MTLRAVACIASAAFAVAVCLAAAHAQTREEFQEWAGFFATASPDPTLPRLAFWLEAQVRRGSEQTVVLVRPGIGADLLPWLSVWAGYAFVPTLKDGSDDGSEHRIWQQLIASHRWAFGLALQGRTRFEQRFGSGGSDVGFRLRQFVRGNWQPNAEIPLGLALWDELFVGLNETDWGAPMGFDQNRFFIGPFLQLRTWARLELGYLLVYLDRAPRDQVQHVLAVNIFAALP